MAVPVKLKNDSIAQDPDGTRHGLGWDLPTYRGHRIIAHGGDHVTGFTTNFFHFMDDKLGIILLTNGMPVNIGDITRTIAGFYLSVLPTKTGRL